MGGKCRAVCALIAGMSLSSLPEGNALAESTEGNALAESTLQGFYLGLQAGYGLGKADILFTDLSERLTLDGLGAEGPVGGLFLGYGRNFARKWHAGLEVEGSLSDIEFELSDIEFEATVNKDSASIEIDKTFGVTARLGYYLIDNGMVFARLGWARSRFNTELNITTDDWFDSELNSITSTRWQDGIRFGGGFQFDLSRNLFSRGEYIATNYDDFGFVSGNERLEIDPWSHIFRLGLAYGF